MHGANFLRFSPSSRLHLDHHRGHLWRLNLTLAAAARAMFRDNGAERQIGTARGRSKRPEEGRQHGKSFLIGGEVGGWRSIASAGIVYSPLRWQELKHVGRRRGAVMERVSAEKTCLLSNAFYFFSTSSPYRGTSAYIASSSFPAIPLAGSPYLAGFSMKSAGIVVVDHSVLFSKPASLAAAS